MAIKNGNWKILKPVFYSSIFKAVFLKSVPSFFSSFDLRGFSMILLLRFILFLAALSKTASFSIAGCQLDMGYVGSFLSLALFSLFHAWRFWFFVSFHSLSKAERDEICPPDYNLPHGTGNFGYIRHNVNKKNVSYMWFISQKDFMLVVCFIWNRHGADIW